MSINIIATNKKAYHDYFVEEKFDAGIVLVGSEVKSIRMGRINLRDSFVYIKNREIFLVGMHITPYEKGSTFNLDATRTRTLLMNRAEIVKLKAKVDQKGYTLIPLSLYFKDSLVKLELGLCKGKELHDKRQALKEKETKREIEREMKDH